MDKEKVNHEEITRGITTLGNTFDTANIQSKVNLAQQASDIYQRTIQPIRPILELKRQHEEMREMLKPKIEQVKLENQISEKYNTIQDSFRNHNGLLYNFSDDNEIKTILIIGNGFDLHHDLPTRYIDFMNFIYEIGTFKHAYKNSLNKEPKKSIKDFPSGMISGRDLARILGENAPLYNQSNIERLIEGIENNKLIRYFFDENFEKEKWIDFEGKIELLLKKLEEYYDTIQDTGIEIIRKRKKYYNSLLKLFDNIGIPFGIHKNFRIKESKFINNIEEEYISEYENIYSSQEEVFFVENINKMKEEVIEKLQEELKDLIICFNIYLSEFIDNIEVDLYEQIKDINPDKILSFNYTNTFMKYYKEFIKDNIEVDFVHGEINKIDYEDCNIVLGIRNDAFDKNGQEDKQLDYVEFQKYFQKMNNDIHNKYPDWLKFKRLSTYERIKYNIHIIGHSLDTTDKEVLEDLLSNYSEKIYVYCYNKKSEIDSKKNMIKIIGKDNMISFERTGKIKFIPLSKRILEKNKRI